MPQITRNTPSQLNRLLTSLIVLFVVDMTSSCAKVEDPISDDQLAFELLNSGRYQDAIVVLERQLASDPGNDQARLRLASAYAGEIGFNLVDAFSAFEPLITFDPKASRVPRTGSERVNAESSENSPGATEISNRAPNTEEREKIKKFERNLLITILDSEMITRVLFSLPYLSGDGRNKIGRSIAILRDISAESSSYRMGLVYEAVLQFLLFSNYMRDSFVGVASASDQPSYPLQIYCGLDMREFLQNLPRSLQHLRAGVFALNDAGSKKDGRFFKNVEKSMHAIESLNKSYQQDSDVFTLAEIGNRGLKENVCD